MGAAIPVMHYNRHGRRRFPLLRHADGYVSRRQHFHTRYRRNCWRHVYRPRAGSVDVLGGQAIRCPDPWSFRNPKLGSEARRYLAEAQKLSPHGELRLGLFHRRDHLVRGNLSNLPIRSSDETVR